MLCTLFANQLLRYHVQFVFHNLPIYNLNFARYVVGMTDWWFIHDCLHPLECWLHCMLIHIIHLVHTQNFRKCSISYPLIRTHPCAYQGVNVSFSENFAYVLNDDWPLYRVILITTKLTVGWSDDHIIQVV